MAGSVAREVSFWEGFFHFSGTKYANFPIAEVASFVSKKPITQDQLKLAIGAVCQRHEIWKHIIQPTKVGRYLWVPRTNTDFINVTEIEEGKDIYEEATALISTAEIVATIVSQCLLECLFKKLPDVNGECSYQLATIHSHAIMDGRSYLQFIHELFKELVGGTEFTQGAGPLPPTESAILDHCSKKVESWDFADKECKYKAPMIPLDNPPASKQARLLRKRFTNIRELQKVCREKRITIHSAVSAALMFGVAKLMTEKKVRFPATFKINTPVDLRNFISDPTGEVVFKGGLSNLISVSMQYINITDPNFSEPNFWSIAKQYQDCVLDDIKTGKFMSTISVTQDGLDESSKELFKLCCPEPDPHSGGRGSLLNISNIGAIDHLFGDYIGGSIRLEDLHGGSWSLCSGDCIYILVATLRGVTHLSFVYCSIYSDESMNLVAEACVEYLEQMATGKGANV